MTTRYLPSRYLPSVAGAVAMTFGLFFVMQLLVSGQMTLPPQIDIYEWDVPWHKTMPPPEPVEQDLPDKPEVKPQPDGPTDVTEWVSDSPPGTIEGIGIGTAPGGTGTAGPVTLAPVDDEMVPLFIVAPVYPVNRLKNGTEGYVVLEFAVDELGNVSDPHVMYAEPQGAFGNAAKKAILKSRFKARIVDGRPVAVTGVRYKYVFEIK